MTINIVKLGSLDHGVLPDEEAFKRFKEAIIEAKTDGTKTIVWGPDVEVLYLTEPETDPQ